nr:unnamed protein product [Spirometra erinaceieuropaei]
MTDEKTRTLLANQDWIQLWQKGITPWHHHSVNEALIEYWDKLHPSDNFNRAYVPLCGKTVDMRWLYQKGVTVVGSDIAEEAAIAFVKEHPQLAMLRTEATLNNGEQTVVYETTVYRKATNTRSILHFRSNHPVGHKRSCVRTLFQRSQTHCSDDDDRKQEVKYLRALFEANGYPKSFIRKCLRKSHSGRSDEEKPKFWLSIPYVKNASEATSRILKPFGIGVAHKPASTIRQQLMRPKDPLPVTEQSAVVYSIPCQDFDARYVGETGKRLGTRLHEHQLAINRKDKLSLVYGHTLERNNNFALKKTRVVGRANDKMVRLMLESWSSSGTFNRAIDLHSAYQALRARLESIQARPMARMKGITRGPLPTLAERESADRESRDRRGTLSHGRTREGGMTMPEERKSISPPSDEGEANEHADAAATTSGMRETQGTPVRQWLGSERPQSANGKQANQRACAGHGTNTRQAARLNKSRPAGNASDRL